MATLAVSHHSHSNGLGGCVLTVGEGDTGQLGLGPDVMERTKPGQVKMEEEVSQICSGGMHTVCLTKKGEVSVQNTILVQCIMWCEAVHVSVLSV